MEVLITPHAAHVGGYVMLGCVFVLVGGSIILLRRRRVSRMPRRVLLSTLVAVVAGGTLAALAATTSGTRSTAARLSGAAPSEPPGAFAGYRWYGHVVSLRGSWTVPLDLVDPTGTPPGSASSWIGAAATGAALGSRAPFIQIGTNEEETAGWQGAEICWAFWTDTARRFSAQYLFAVSPDDVISASLRLVHGRWRLSLTDTTSGQSAHFWTSEDTHGTFAEADWVQEHILHPSDEGYPQLSPIVFSRLDVNSAAPSQASLDSLSMSVRGRVLTPTPLEGDSFTISATTARAH